MKAVFNNLVQQNSARLKKNVLKEQGNITPEFLYKIITNKNGKPDHIAISIYVEARSWFKFKKTKVDGNVIYSSKLKGHGWQIGYEYFSKKYKCSADVIRKKLVLLEKLDLITRDFRTEYFYGKRFNNLMYILVWKDTPHFYSEIGLEKLKKVSTSYPQNQGHLCLKSRTPILENKDNIYVIPNNNPIEKDIALGYISFSSSKDIPVIENTDARARATENATCENAILAEHSQIAIPESKENITNSQLKEIPIMQQEETVLSEKETRKMQLSKAIFDNFGMSANAIQDNCQFEELSLDKISVKPNAGVSFDDIEKNKIRKCIKEVYGEKITILTRINKLVLKSPTEIPKNTFDSKLLENANWQCLKRNLHRSFLKRYEEKYADHIIKNWFSKLTVSNDSDNKRLVLVGDCFVIDRIYQEYFTFLEQAMVDSDFSVELHFKNNTERPIILTN